MKNYNRTKKEEPEENSLTVGAPGKERTILIEPGAAAKLPKPVTPLPSEPRHSSWSRLDHLYRISRLLTEFESIERTISAVLGLVTNTLPLRSAILIEEVEGRARIFAWHLEDTTALEVQTARTHAKTAYSYLTGAVSIRDRATVEESAFMTQSKTKKQNFIVIPLVVDHGTVFGVLQVQAAVTFNEADLAFANALANQLATALDRYHARLKEVAARMEAEAAERRMRFLADASRLLAASLDRVSTLEAVGQLAVNHIADLCIIESAAEPFHRVILSPQLREQMTEKEAAEAFAAVASTMIRTGRSALYPETAVDFKGDQRLESNEPRVLKESANLFKSYMCVPLQTKERTIGAMTLAWARSGDSYTWDDLLLLRDLASRAVVTIENSRIYTEALNAIRSRDHILSIVAHDLRSPLTVISGWVNLCLSKPSQDGIISNRKQLEAIQRSTQRMIRLIEDLLDTTRIETEHLFIQQRLCPIPSLVEEALESVQSQADSKDLQVKNEIPSGIAPVLADHDRIIQVFTNLIGNAIKFTPPGGRITLRAEQLEKEVRFSVEDTGPGIPEDQTPHIFDRFWQASQTTQSGVGVGLFIVKGIVEEHGGKVWVNSQPGAGSTFFFTLPLDSPRSHP
jgi:signal transduction histidine kinase